MNSALRRMGIGADEHAARGFRSSASGILRGYRGPAYPPRRVNCSQSYSRATYWDERVAMLVLAGA